MKGKGEEKDKILQSRALKIRICIQSDPLTQKNDKMGRDYSFYEVYILYAS